MIKLDQNEYRNDAFDGQKDTMSKTYREPKPATITASPNTIVTDRLAAKQRSSPFNNKALAMRQSEGDIKAVLVPSPEVDD